MASVAGQSKSINSVSELNCVSLSSFEGIYILSIKVHSKRVSRNEQFKESIEETPQRTSVREDVDE